MHGFLVVVKVYEGEYHERGLTANDIKEIDMFSSWTTKKPEVADLLRLIE